MVLRMSPVDLIKTARELGREGDSGTVGARLALATLLADALEAALAREARLRFVIVGVCSTLTRAEAMGVTDAGRVRDHLHATAMRSLAALEESSDGG